MSWPRRREPDCGWEAEGAAMPAGGPDAEAEAEAEADDADNDAPGSGGRGEGGGRCLRGDGEGDECTVTPPLPTPPAPAPRDNEPDTPPFPPLTPDLFDMTPAALYASASPAVGLWSSHNNHRIAVCHTQYVA